MMGEGVAGGLPLADYDGLYFIDDFSNGIVAAGAVHDTASSDGLAKRYVLDTGSKLSVSTKLDCSGAQAIGDPNIRYRTAADGAIAFAADDAHIFGITPGGEGYPKGTYDFGYDTNLLGGTQKPYFGASIANMRAEDSRAPNAHAIDLEYDDSVSFSRMLFKVDAGGNFLLLKHVGGTRWQVEYASKEAHAGTAAYPLFITTSTTNDFIGSVGLVSAVAMPAAWAGTAVVMTNPSALDTGTMPDPSCFVTFSNITVPSAGAIQVEFRKSGSDELMVEIDSAGRPIIYENGVAKVTGDNGEVANTEDLEFEFVDNTTRFWTYGEQNPTPEPPAPVAIVTLTTGTGINVASLGTGGAIGEIKVWKSYHNAPFVMP
jgi:hypothetical protein